LFKLECETNNSADVDHARIHSHFPMFSV